VYACSLGESRPYRQADYGLSSLQECDARTEAPQHQPIMNDACTFEAVEAVLRDRSPAERVLTFLASRSKRSGRELSEPIEKVFRGASAALEQMSLTLVEKRTAQDFDAAFAELFPKYVALTTSLSQIAIAIVPDDALDRLTREAICELEADFRDQATATFGSAVKDQAIFTIWTVRKINDIVTSIHSTKITDESKKEQDKEFSDQFTVSSLVGHFSLDCLSIALRHNRPIYPEVMGRVMDGLRSMVNAYAWARRGLALRSPHQEEPLDSDPDEGDDALIRLSVRSWSESSDDSLPNAS
jgi:hypothetical protein